MRAINKRGFMAKAVAKSLAGIPDDPHVAVLMNRAEVPDRVIDELLKKWEADLQNRRPAAVYTEAEEGREPLYVGTDLDLFTTTMSLAQRNAIINIPKYEPLRAATKHPHERVVSPEHRHGHVKNVTSNENTHAFSVGIIDVNVAQKTAEGEVLGAPRNYLLTDDEGNLYSGWKTIEFDPVANNYFEQKELWKDGKINFLYFAHPALFGAFYGKRYLETKIAAKRVKEEASHYRKIARELYGKGIRLAEAPPSEEQVHAERGPSQPRRVAVLQAELKLSEFRGDYPFVGIDRDGNIVYKEFKEPVDKKYQAAVLRYSRRRAKDLSYGIGRKVRAVVRATELAFRKFGLYEGRERYPSWPVGEWERGYLFSPDPRVKKPYTTWNALRISDEVVLLYRLHEAIGYVRA